MDFPISLLISPKPTPLASVEHFRQSLHAFFDGVSGLPPL